MPSLTFNSAAKLNAELLSPIRPQRVTFAASAFLSVVATIGETVTYFDVQTAWALSSVVSQVLFMVSMCVIIFLHIRHRYHAAGWLFSISASLSIGYVALSAAPIVGIPIACVGFALMAVLPEFLIPNKPTGPKWVLGLSAIYISALGLRVLLRGADFINLPQELVLLFVLPPGAFFMVWYVADRAKQLLLRSLEHARAASHAKSLFLANMSHELRTPLNAIIGYSELLIEDAYEDQNLTIYESVEDVERIKNAASHLFALINDVLDISQVEAGKIDIKLKKVCLQEIVQTVGAVVQPLAEKNGNTLTFEAPEKDIFLQTDELRLSQILINLFTNAAKFTADGTITIHVEKTDEKDVALHVQDTGQGISEDNLKKIFDRFTKINDKNAKKLQDGTGLGLTLTKEFCALLHIKLHVESAVGEGSTFSLHFSPERVLS